MTEVISVKFKDTGRGYYFSPEEKKVKIGDKVIVETQYGLEIGTVSEENHMVEDETLVLPLKRMVRFANEKQIFNAVFGDDRHIFDADTAFPRQIDTGLYRHDLAHLERTVTAARRQRRRFVDL